MRLQIKMLEIKYFQFREKKQFGEQKKIFTFWKPMTVDFTHTSGNFVIGIVKKLLRYGVKH